MSWAVALVRTSASETRIGCHALQTLRPPPALVQPATSVSIASNVTIDFIADPPALLGMLHRVDLTERAPVATPGEIGCGEYGNPPTHHSHPAGDARPRHR